MARSDSEQLTFYLELRDVIEDSMVAAAGKDMTTFVIRNRTFTQKSAQERLDFVNQQIDRYRCATNPGSTRNTVRFPR